jgi:hypothetical protein
LVDNAWGQGVVFYITLTEICGNLDETREFLGWEEDSVVAACYLDDRGDEVPVIFRSLRIKALVDAIGIKGAIAIGRAQRAAAPPC